VNRIKAAVDLARSEVGIPIVPAKLDAPPWLLNVINGTLDLRTGQLRRHSQDDMLTKLASATYDPTARCPTWERFLSRIMAGRQALIDYLQRAVGYSLTGSVREQVLFFLHGEGANGKSTFLEAIKYVMGEYASTAAPDLLLVRQGEPHPTQLADLHGRRFVSTVEVDDGRRLAESLVKQLTGGDGVKARRMREDFWEIMPTWKIWLAANHRPEIRGNDHAIWRRIRLVPFDVRIPPDEQDKDLLDKLKAEAPGILAWAVRGCADWLRIGLSDPPEVLSATEAYKSESDLIGGFLAECNTGDPNYRSRTSELYAAFSTWVERQGERQTMTGKRFGMELRRRGIQLDDGRRWYIGVALQDPPPEGPQW
jgi:putative DNA primase/helicase